MNKRFDMENTIRNEYSAKEFYRIDLELEITKRLAKEDKCGVILMRGKRKGEPCGKPIKYKQEENNYIYWVCGLHRIKK